MWLPEKCCALESVRSQKAHMNPSAKVPFSNSSIRVAFRERRRRCRAAARGCRLRPKSPFLKSELQHFRWWSECSTARSHFFPLLFQIRIIKIKTESEDKYHLDLRHLHHLIPFTDKYQKIKIGIRKWKRNFIKVINIKEWSVERIKRHSWWECSLFDPLRPFCMKTFFLRCSWSRRYRELAVRWPGTDLTNWTGVPLLF